MKTINANSTGNQFIQDINDNFAECMTGGSADDAVTTKVALQGGKLVSSTGYVDGKWCSNAPSSIGASVPSFTWTDDDFYKYFHTPNYLSLLGNSIKTITPPAGTTMTIFCYDETFAKVDAVNAVANIPTTARYIKVQIYQSSNFTLGQIVTIVTTSEPEWVKNTAEPLVPQFFNYECKPKKIWDTIGTTLHPSPTGASADVDSARYHDNGYIILPPTYTQNGKPTKFVLFFNGDLTYTFVLHNPYQTVSNSKVAASVYEKNFKYLCNMGYAVVSVCGYTSMWKDDAGAIFSDPWTPKWTPAFKASVMALYDHLMTNYNLEPAAYLMAKSAGGSALTYIASTGMIPVRAAAGLSIQISFADMISQIYLPNQKNLQKRLGATNWNSFALNASSTGDLNNRTRASSNGNSAQQAEAGRISDNKELFHAFDGFVANSDINYDDYLAGVLASDPFNNVMASGLATAIANAYKKTAAPIKLWCGTQDPATPYFWHEKLRDWITRCGGECELRSYTGSENNNHGTFCGGSAITTSADTPYGGTMSGVNIGIVEAVEWFKRW